MKLYIAGPMTGIPQFNFPAFNEMAERLRSQGYEVVSPAELDDDADRAMALASIDGHVGSVEKTWGDFLARDVKLIADDGIDGILVLPGWEKSRGARLETFVANALCGLPILTWDPVLEAPFVLNELALFRAWTGDPTLQARRRVYA